MSGKKKGLFPFSLSILSKSLSYAWVFLEVLFIWPKQATENLQREGMCPYVQNYFKSWINNNSGGHFRACLDLWSVLLHVSCMFHREQASPPVLFWLGQGGPALGLLCCCHMACKPFWESDERALWMEGWRRTWNMLGKKRLMLRCCETLRWIRNVSTKALLCCLAKRKCLASLAARC